jgi:ATP-binding cassette, subfamily B, bacterial
MKLRLPPVLFVVGRLMSFSPRHYVLGGAMWTMFFVLPLVSGLILKAFFDHLSDGQLVSMDSILWLCAAFVGVEFVRAGAFWLGLYLWTYWWNGGLTILRANALGSILGSPGPAAERLPHSSGEAVSRFRDDADDLIILSDNVVDLVGSFLFATGALIIMAAIDPTVTLALVIPMLVVLVLTRSLRNLIRRVHRRARELGAVVTAYIGEMFSGVLTLKTSGAQEAALDRLREHNRRRRHAAVKDRLAMDMLNTSTAATVEISIGLVLLLAAPSMRSGEFTIGDFALFMSYIGWLTMFPQVLGRMLYRVPQGSVATDRLTRLMAAHESEDDLSRFNGLWLREDPPPAIAEIPARDDGLEMLTAHGLTATHGDGGHGVADVDLTVQRGSFTVITGAVGSGKTTLVRTLLGLLPATRGTIAWNGQPVSDPGTFLVPNRVAYAGQVPRLFSESLRENLTMGWPATDEELAHAIELAAFEGDLDDMHDGLDTVVGPRGVRLSGGQVQRSTAARALVRAPDLLVVDDLSSALDVETEKILWNRIASATGNGRGPSTLLVVSHRRAALERADQVIVLDRGRVVGIGPLAELLETCPEMRRLWSEEAVIEAE